MNNAVEQPATLPLTMITIQKQDEYGTDTSFFCGLKSMNALLDVRTTRLDNNNSAATLHEQIQINSLQVLLLEFDWRANLVHC